MYQLDANNFTMIFLLINGLYMFRTFTCPSSGVLIYKVVSLPHVVLCPRCCGCGPTEFVCSHVHCLSVSFQLAWFFRMGAGKGQWQKGAEGSGRLGIVQG